MTYKRGNSERGESILSTYVALLIMGIILSAGTSLFTNSLKHSADIRALTQAQIAATNILDMMSFEMRMMGSGMPLTQSSFSYDNVAIRERALPILLSASNSSITFRLNEAGSSALLTSDASPSGTTMTVNLDSSEAFNLGDTVYISSFSVGGTHALRGVISQKNGNTISLSSVTATPSATFPASSVVQPVSDITYTSTLDGISRSSSRGSSMFVGSMFYPNATFELTYYDGPGQILSLPLTATSIRNTVAGIGIRILVNSESRFDGSPRDTEAQQIVALRNLTLSR